MKDILTELRWRELIHQSTDEDILSRLLESESQAVYCGFDPTSDSLHVGSLLPLMILRRFQQAGHRPIALVGGATGMIGDPSGKSKERNLLTAEDVAVNVDGLKRQMSKYIDFDSAGGARLVNNLEWMNEFSLLEFLRNIGKNFPVNVMLAKESVKGRLGAEDGGLSYTEFSYMLLQAYDFVHLNREFDCTLQVGGSDQWGNITAGIDLARKMHGVQLHGLTSPLLLTSDGRKMGKTESGAVWLDAKRTSPYLFYQYWLNVADSDVLRCLRYLTEIEQEEYVSLEVETTVNPSERAAQKRLADWLTEFIHGSAGLAAAKKASAILFGGEVVGESDEVLGEIFSNVPNKVLPRSDVDGEGLRIVDALCLSGLVSSSSEARRSLKEGSVYVNNVRIGDMNRRLTAADLASESMMVIRRGKKTFALLRFVYEYI